MTKKPEFKPLSLAQAFIPPDGLRGSFGWICGYSADSAFMDDVAGRFTLMTRAQRAHLGQLSLALMVDPSNKQIPLTDAPGVAHLPIREDGKPFRLLHAKVALLLFECQQGSGSWHLRLIVSTGNWTRQTVEDSLDMAWTLNLTGSDLAAAPPAQAHRQACADIKAAADMFNLLRKHADTRLLEVHPDGRDSSASSGAIALFEQRLRLTVKHADGQPRFCDNRKQSLLSQLAGLVENTGKPAARNYLAMGSGFFEGGSSADQPPAQLTAIINVLQSAGKPLLTKSPECHVIVNPLACQAVATSFEAMLKKDWKVFGATAPSYFRTNSPRSLHAKFIFSAHRSGTEGKCANGWLYLGSGNLTSPGFGKPMRRASGNLEAGVVLASGPLQFERARPEELLSNLLPIGPGGALELMQAPAAGERADERGVQFQAGPVACLLWRKVEGVGFLSVPGQAAAELMDFMVLDEAGAPCTRNVDGEIAWPGPRPRQVRLRWGDQGEFACLVPVLDDRGQLAATDAPALGLDEAWSQLDAFPMAQEDDDNTSDDDESSPPSKRPPAGSGASAGSYPVRQMMQLMEKIAHKQTGIGKADWSTWCWRLEQTLLQATSSPVVASFLAWELNPLSVLRVASFVPDFCLKPGSAEMAAYEKTLLQVERAWKVDGLVKLGVFA